MVESKNLFGKFISYIVLQVLSFVVQNEREKIIVKYIKRQAEYIKLAKAKGVHMGRNKFKLPDNFYEVVIRFHKCIKKKEFSNQNKLKYLTKSKNKPPLEDLLIYFNA